MITRDLRNVVVLLAAYVLTARLGLSMAPVGGFATHVWPPSGISLAALVILGRRAWPGVALGAFAANLWQGASIGVAGGIAAGNALEAVVGAYALQRFGFQRSIDRLRDVLALVVLAAGLSTMVSATIGAVSLGVGGVIPLVELMPTWRAWWLGDVTGILIVAPLLLVWSTRSSVWMDRPRIAEMIGLALSITVVGTFLFTDPNAPWMAIFDPRYLIVPPLIWAALRFGQRGATAALFVDCAIAVAGIVMGHGPFLLGSLQESLLSLQMFMTVTAITVLFLGAVVSERRLALLAAHENEARTLMALDAGRMGAWEWDIASGKVKWSPALEVIHGLPVGSFDGTFEAFQKDIHPEDRERVLAAISRTVESDDDHFLEYRIVAPDRGIRWVEAKGRITRDRAGHAVRMHGVCSDVTERKEAERALIESDQRKDQFLALLAHELRNPLAPIRNAVEVLRIKGAPDPILERCHDMIDRQVTHMSRLVDDLLDVSRITQGKVLLRSEPVDLVHVVETIAEDYRAGIESAGLALEVDVQKEPMWMRGDATRLSQVVGNVLHNATKFCAPGNQVFVSLFAESERSACIAVRDTGPGMDAAILPHVFETFTQADRSLDRSRGGLGLGLAIVKGLVELHGGTVSAESAGLGCGSSFTIHLPLDPSAAPEKRPTTDPAARGKGQRVLIIEDNEDAADSLSSLLEMKGHLVAVEYVGASGVAKARTWRPDVVICDIGLPNGMDGYAVAGAIRRDHELASIQLIALTGYGQEEDRNRARQAGFDQYFTKPLNPSTLDGLLASLEPSSSIRAP